MRKLGTTCVLTPTSTYGILKTQHGTVQDKTNQGEHMISINTGDVILDGAVSALIKRCKIPETTSISICSDTTPYDAAADHGIVIASSEDFTKSARHREYSALYNENYHVLFRPLSISAFEEILDFLLSAKSEVSPEFSEIYL